MVRLQSPEEMKSYVKSAQDTAFVTNGLAKTSLDDDNEVNSKVTTLYYMKK